MPNAIERDVYVLRNTLKNPIAYVRGTDLLPIIFHFRDFTIPSGATATAFTAKPDGNAVYGSAVISGNDVTIDVTQQMFIVLGMSMLQVEIKEGEETLTTFIQPVMVEPNLKAGDFPESSSDITFLDDAIEQANEAVETATTAAQQAATAVQNANTAISNANDAIADVNVAVASMNANFANLAQVATINALQTTAKTVVGAIDELNSKTVFTDVQTINFEVVENDDPNQPRMIMWFYTNKSSNDGYRVDINMIRRKIVISKVINSSIEDIGDIDIHNTTNI